jgi:hypothetical protein
MPAEQKQRAEEEDWLKDNSSSFALTHSEAKRVERGEVARGKKRAAGFRLGPVRKTFVCANICDSLVYLEVAFPPFLINWCGLV